MQRKVAVVAQKQINSADVGMPRERMLYELVKSLYEEVGISRDDIDTFVLCSNDFNAGHTISNVFEDCPVGAYMKDETKVEADGVWAATYALARILSGLYETALVVGNSQGGSVMRPYLMMDYQLAPVYDRQLGLLNELSAAGLQAHAFLAKKGLTPDTLDEIAARNLADAAKNPDAFNGKAGASAADVAATDMLYEPLRKGHCYPFTDGACALLIASEEKAKKLTDRPAWIRGVGDSIDTYYPERDVVDVKSVKLAGERAAAMAGIGLKDLDLVELSAKFAHQEPILLEGLGLPADGGAASVSPSGGAFGAYAFNAAGLVRIAECFKQLTGSAGDTQVEGAGYALAHGQDGLCMQHNAVMIMSSEEG
ncbi:MAG: hypothetical protein KKF41_09140 [Actinobacteria bacterium]|nr:hypothetical protein [Actinomycetota bacterium]MBU1945200.1 hypothetical protein [Actinomycetota bacterium]MBU2687738.1 hypothetical protein [Actinomycetota bacterium]